MKRLHLLLLGGALVAGIGTIAVETRLIAARRAQHQHLVRQIADTTQALSALRRQRDGLARDLALAEQQLLRLPAISLAKDGPASVAGGRGHVAEAWIARTKQLRDLAAANPAQLIPEMKLLTDEDWMRVAQHAAFDTDAQRREALAALRDAAKALFQPFLSAAVRKWTIGAGIDKTPTSMAELIPHFDPPINPAVLSRYEIVPQANPSSHPKWRICEISAIDEEYDTRRSVGANGSHGWSGGGPLTWNADYASRVQRAYRAYSAARSGAEPAGFAQVVPYIDPPFPPPIVERLLKQERERRP